jgi:hypothetical protein
VRVLGGMLALLFLTRALRPCWGHRSGIRCKCRWVHTESLDGEGAMMVRALYAMGVVSLVAAGIVFGFCILRWLENGQNPEQAQSPSMTERFRDALAAHRDRVSETTPVLLREAQAFADLLNPAPSPQPVPPGPNPGGASPRTLVPAISPPTASPSFRLQGTVYCPSRPQTSMALISTGMQPIGDQRWVREGSVVGHFVVQEIRPGVILCRTPNGDQTHEMPVEAGPPRPSIVRRYIPELTHASSPSTLGGARSDVSEVIEGTPQSLSSSLP